MQALPLDLPLDFDGVYDPLPPQLGSAPSALDAIPVSMFWDAPAGPAPEFRTPPRREFRAGGSDCFTPVEPGLGFTFASAAAAFPGFGPGLGDDRRRQALNSIESAATTADLPLYAPGPFTEPVGADGCPFNLRQLNFLDEVPSVPAAAHQKLSLVTAPADFCSLLEPRLSQEQAVQPLPQPQQPQPAHGLPPKPASGERGGSASSCGSQGTPFAARLGPQAQQAAASRGRAEDGGCSALAERASSLPSISDTAVPAAGEDWTKQAPKRGLERSGVNPRKTEQNRRAQARFRQRKKDMFLDQQRQIQELTTKLEAAVQEKRGLQEQAGQQQAAAAAAAEAAEARIAALQARTKGSGSAEELADACWELAQLLAKGRSGSAHSRAEVGEMVAAMLAWGSPALACLRRELAEQLGECLRHGGEQPDLPANLWLTDLVRAYERMAARWCDCQPRALPAFLALELPEQAGRAADAAFWQRVAAQAELRPQQRLQLAEASASLAAQLRAVRARRQEVACMLEAAGQQQQQQPQQQQQQQQQGAEPRLLLSSLAQAQQALELHSQSVREEQAAVADCLATVSQVLGPVQHARLLVAAHPFPLDTLALCQLLGGDGSSPAQSSQPPGAADARSAALQAA